MILDVIIIETRVSRKRVKQKSQINIVNLLSTQNILKANLNSLFTKHINSIIQ